jgi:hypothetical protein
LSVERGERLAHRRLGEQPGPVAPHLHLVVTAELADGELPRGDAQHLLEALEPERLQLLRATTAPLN